MSSTQSQNKNEQSMLGALYDLVEQGYVPDPLVKLMVRFIISRQVRRARSEDLAHYQIRVNKMMSVLDSAPIEEGFNSPEFVSYRKFPADFYSKFLGKNIKNSCSLWPVGESSLDNAEDVSFEQICEKSGLRDGMTIMDMRSGVGSLAFWIAIRFPNIRVVSTVGSKRKQAYLEAQINKFKLDNIEVYQIDDKDSYASIGYDLIFAIEVLDYLNNFNEVMKEFSSFLNPDGKLFVQMYCHRELCYPLHNFSDDDWMHRFFLHSRVMPSDSFLLYYQKDLVLDKHWILNGSHYSKTAKAWLANFDKNKGEILNVLEREFPGEAMTWYNKWRMYLLTLDVLFSSGGGNEWCVSQYLFSNRAK